MNFLRKKRSKKAMIKILKKLLPNTSPKARAGLARKTAERQVTNSGKAVTPASKIPPIRALLTFDVLLNKSA